MRKKLKIKHYKIAKILHFKDFCTIKIWEHVTSCKNKFDLNNHQGEFKE